MDHFVQALSICVAVRGELVRGLQNHEDQAESTDEADEKECGEEESFEFEALQCQSLLVLNGSILSLSVAKIEKSLTSG